MNIKKVIESYRKVRTKISIIILIFLLILIPYLFIFLVPIIIIYYLYKYIKKKKEYERKMNEYRAIVEKWKREGYDVSELEEMLK